MNRRRFIKTSTAVVIGGTALIGFASVPILRSNTPMLRPPGALEEDRFLASCIKCGQCLQVCPPQVVELAGIGKGFAVGTPFITPRQGGCILCAGLPCVLACPTGSLDHALSEGKDAKMGLAVIKHPGSCLAINGINDIIFRLENRLADKANGTGNQSEAELLSDIAERLNNAENASFREKFSLTDLEPESVSGLAGNLSRRDIEWLLNFARTTEFSSMGCRICLDKCPIKDQKTIEFVKREPLLNRRHEKQDDDDDHEYKQGNHNEKRRHGHGRGHGRGYGRRRAHRMSLNHDNEYWPVVQSSCVGCGVCEEKCPTPVASIQIVPRLE